MSSDKSSTSLIEKDGVDLYENARALAAMGRFNLAEELLFKALDAFAIDAYSHELCGPTFLVLADVLEAQGWGGQALRTIGQVLDG